MVLLELISFSYNWSEEEEKLRRGEEEKEQKRRGEGEEGRKRGAHQYFDTPWLVLSCICEQQNHQCHHAGRQACMHAFIAVLRIKKKDASIRETFTFFLPLFFSPYHLSFLSLSPLSPLSPMFHLPYYLQKPWLLGWGGGYCRSECTRHVILRHLMSHHATSCHITLR